MSRRLPSMIDECCHALISLIEMTSMTGPWSRLEQLYPWYIHEQGWVSMDSYQCMSGQRAVSEFVRIVIKKIGSKFQKKIPSFFNGKALDLTERDFFGKPKKIIYWCYLNLYVPHVFNRPPKLKFSGTLLRSDQLIEDCSQWYTLCGQKFDCFILICIFLYRVTTIFQTLEKALFSNSNLT